MIQNDLLNGPFPVVRHNDAVYVLHICIQFPRQLRCEIHREGRFLIQSTQLLISHEHTRLNDGLHVRGLRREVEFNPRLPQ